MKNIYITIIIVLFFAKPVLAQDYFLGEVKLVSFGFAPNGWARCEGQTLPINQNQALFSLLGTTYGGNGITTFKLPDYRGRVAVGKSASTSYGQTGGSETTTLVANNIPAHSHNMSVAVSSTAATANVPTAASNLGADKIVINGQTLAVNAYSTAAANTSLRSNVSTTAGATTPTPINNRQPYLGMQYIIALQGIYPSQN